MMSATNMLSSQETDYDSMVNEEPVFTILDHEFEVDELCDIVNHGMSAGVSGFIYTRDCVDKFNEFDNEIEEYLSDWYHDNMGEDNYIGVISGSMKEYGAHAMYPVCSVDELKNRMVWSYVELKAYEILCEIKHPDFYWLRIDSRTKLFTLCVSFLRQS